MEVSVKTFVVSFSFLSCYFLIFKGCFVTNVLIGGPADVQGNIEVGDQILEFNGHSLIDSTYEEVRILQDHCGDIVQLVVQHNNVRLHINNGQVMSSIEISRHFETVPRLSSSLTRKRRNLPPLPPSLSSTFPKQSKRELFETVETLEVPNVKELKPILINRGRLLGKKTFFLKANEPRSQSETIKIKQKSARSENRTYSLSRNVGIYFSLLIDEVD